MKQHFTLTIISVLFFSLICHAQDENLSYTLSRKDSTSLIIKVAFTGDSSGSTIIHLPNEWASQKKLYTTISGIAPVSPQTIISPTDKPYNYTIKYKPGTKVVFTYKLRKDWSGLLKYPLYFRPVIQPDFFYFEGYSGLVYPDLADTTHIKCRLTYKGFAKGDFIGNSFYANTNTETFTVSLDDLLNSVFCAGKFRSKTITAKGRKIVIALTGTPAFSDTDAFSNISNIILAERHFWNDAGPDYYFTIFLPLYDQGNTGGTAHYHAFSLFQSADLGLYGNLLPMIAHEYFHNWLGLGLKMPTPDEPYKWFSEGFTEYYSYKLLNKTSIISKKGLIDKVNTYVKDYFLSPYFNMANQDITGKYWDNSEIKLLSYRKGLILAFLLDSRIAENKRGSLDELLKELYRQSNPSMIFSDSLFNKLVNSYCDQRTSEAIAKTNAGDNQPLAQMLFNMPNYHTDTLKVNKVFDLGFDFRASKAAGKVVGLTANSNAAKAGLAEGMKLDNKFSIWFNNTEKPAMIGVTENGTEKFIQYIPVLKVDKQVPQIVLDK